MTHLGNIAFLSVLAVVFLVILTGWPTVFSDSNEFVREFLDQDLLAFMGVVLTLSIGLLAQLYISAAKLRDVLDDDAVTEIRDELKSSAKVLLIVFFVTFALVFIKSALGPQYQYVPCINAGLIFLLVVYLLILADVILAVFDFDL